MKILAFSGSHENPIVTDAFLERVECLEEPPDLFVSAGDLGPRSMSKIFRSLLPLDRPILYVLGNHILHHPETTRQVVLNEIAGMENAHHLDISNYEHEDLSFIGQDAGTDFADDHHDLLRYQDLIEKAKRTDSPSIVLVTHHAPLGIFDAGTSYPLHSYIDNHGVMHAGSLSIRFFVNEFEPRIHIFAHCHSDGSRSSVVDGTLFANVCHLERRRRDGRYGVTGSFEIIDTDEMRSTSYHLSKTTPTICKTCGETNYMVYGRCINCVKGSTGLIPRDELP